MPKKTSIRTCISCGTSADKYALVRFVRDTNGKASVDTSGHAPGRGAYLCHSAQCFAKMRAKHTLSVRLRCKVGTADYDRLEDAFSKLL